MEALPIKLYDIFRSKLQLADPDAKELVETFDKAMNTKHENTMAIVQKDMQSLKEFVDVKFSEMDRRFSEVDRRFDELEARLDYRFSEVDRRFSELDKRFATKEDMANTKAEIIRWMFLFWIGQVVTTFGFILLFLKK